MALRSCAALLVFVLPPAAAELPQLRIEPTAGGSILYVKNNSAQPLSAFLIELVDYPGSSFTYWEDVPTPPVAPGAEKRIPITNMTVGAVPDYVKMQSAIYADGSIAGTPEKAAALLDRRRGALEATRELIRRCERISDPAALIANLREWSVSLQPQGRRPPPATLSQIAVRNAVQSAISRVTSGSVPATIASLKETEQLLASVKPPL